MRRRAFHHLPTRARGKRPRCERCEFPYSRVLRKSLSREMLSEFREGQWRCYERYCVECEFEVKHGRQDNNRGDLMPLRTSFQLTETPELCWKD